MRSIKWCWKVGIIIILTGMFDMILFASTSPIVSIVSSHVPKAADLDLKEIRTMVNSAIELAGGLRSIIANGNTVVIKPNLVATRA
ncbi:MAG: hypothetical protein AABY86_17795, partial [Bdellovibrionota bacterium]